MSEGKTNFSPEEYAEDSKWGRWCGMAFCKKNPEVKCPHCGAWYCKEHSEYHFHLIGKKG